MPAILDFTAPDPSLLWLFYLVLAFLLATIVVGALASRASGDDQTPQSPPASDKPPRADRKPRDEKKPAK